MPVDTPRADYSSFLPKWKRLRDCHGGRDAVLAAGAAYVPDLPGASTAANAAYRLRGNFYNAVQRTVFGMVGMLYQKDITVDFPKRLEVLLKDVTYTAVSNELFSFTATLETLLMGRFGILVDMSSETTGARPFLAGYTAENIISWSTEKFGGEGTLTRVILREIYEEVLPDDEFVQKECLQYRVLSLIGSVYSQQLWRKYPGQDVFVRHEEPITPLRRGQPLDFIPFIFLGPLHITPELMKPPLEDLADVNLGHWRNSVDYEQGLHLVALPTPYVSGMKASTATDEPLKIGPSVVWELDVHGSAGMVEFTGAGMKSIAEAMEEKKKQMASLGARLMESEPRAQETATAVSMRHSGDHATLGTLAIAMGQGLSMALRTLAWWMGTEAKPDDVKASVELNKSYLAIKAQPQEVLAALQALQAGKMSFETYWNILTKGGWGRDGITAEDELDQIAKEEPELPDVDPADVLNPDGSVTHADGSKTMPDGTVVPAPVVEEIVPPVKPKKKTIRGPDGKVKYEIEEE